MKSATDKIKAEQVEFKGWKALKVTSGDLTVHITPEIGGRINGCAYKGKELLYTQEAYHGVVVKKPETLEDLKKQKIKQGFRFYGGYKTWLSPQGAWPQDLPYFDLDSGVYDMDYEQTARDLRVRLKSPLCRESGVELTKDVIFSPEENLIRINQGMANRSPRKVELGLWDVTQVLRPARVYMPLRRRSRFPEGIKNFDAENPDRQAVLKYVNTHKDYAVVRCTDPVRFKVGTDAQAGWLAGFVPREGALWIVFKKSFEVFGSVRFGHDCAAEVFNSDERPHLEMEVHAPLVQLAPGHRFTWMGSWSFAEVPTPPSSRAELDKILVRM